MVEAKGAVAEAPRFLAEAAAAPSVAGAVVFSTLAPAGVSDFICFFFSCCFELTAVLTKLEGLRSVAIGLGSSGTAGGGGGGGGRGAVLTVSLRAGASSSALLSSFFVLRRFGFPSSFMAAMKRFSVGSSFFPASAAAAANPHGLSLSTSIPLILPNVSFFSTPVALNICGMRMFLMLVRESELSTDESESDSDEQELLEELSSEELSSASRLSSSLGGCFFTVVLVCTLGVAIFPFFFAALTAGSVWGWEVILSCDVVPTRGRAAGSGVAGSKGAAGVDLALLRCCGVVFAVLWGVATGVVATCIVVTGVAARVGVAAGGTGVTGVAGVGAGVAGVAGSLILGVYRSLPALWGVKSRDYSNRIKKNEQYEELLRKYKGKYPDAEKQQLAKKINSLRTNFRKELKRISDSERSGIGAGDVVEFSLWYFEEMRFLIGLEEASITIILISYSSYHESY
nr:unnamed protein product [Callosobruchus analis]